MLRNTHLPLFEIFREIVVEKADFTENDTIQVCGNHGKRSHFHKNFVKATFLLNKVSRKKIGYRKFLIFHTHCGFLILCESIIQYSKAVDFTKFFQEVHCSLCGNYRYSFSLYFGKNSVKVTILLKKLPNS